MVTILIFFYHDPYRVSTMNVEKAMEDIAAFGGGIFDTSSLIYLGKIGLLSMATQVFSVIVIPQVQREFKQELPQEIHPLPAPAGAADQVIVELAKSREDALVSEDKKVLLAAKRAGLVHFNSLMVILALLHHGHLSTVQSRRFCMALFEYARYDVKVRKFGEKLLEQIVLQNQYVEKNTKT